MPWKLISFLLSLMIVVAFIGFNLDNVSDISFGFTVLTDVPIFISLLIAFLCGAVFMLPSVIGKSRGSRVKDTMPKKTSEISSDGPDKAIPGVTDQRSAVDFQAGKKAGRKKK